MAYVRHRSRMVQMSIIQDLSDTLVACRWMAGTTSRPVTPPGESSARIVTTTSDQIFALTGGHAVTLLDYFPQTLGEDNPADGTDPNTFAVDTGQAGDETPLELGSNTVEQPYLFNLAFYAVSDAMATAVMGDLKDRYAGRIVAPEAIMLHDFLADEDIGYMDVDSFRYARDLDSAGLADAHITFAELTVVDLIEA